MSWCPKCHYGNETTTFGAGTDRTISSKSGNIRFVHTLRCPQCRAEFDYSLSDNPFPKREERRDRADRKRKESHDDLVD
jgi:hypothetical protein